MAELVGSQVYGGHAKEGVDTPYVIVSRISGQPFNTLSGPNTLGDFEARLQVDCIADRYADAKRIGDATRTALSGWRDAGAGIISCMLDNEQDDTEPNLDGSNVVTQRVIQDYIVHYQ